MREVYLPEGTEYNGTPRTVVQATNLFLQLHQHGGLVLQSDRDQAREFIQMHTFPLLDTASRGSGRVFGLAGVHKKFITNSQSVDLNEAADYVNVVFAWVHEMYKSPLLPMGFSRDGMLKAPQSIEEFDQRIREMKKELMLLVAGMRDPSTLHTHSPGPLRADAFFHVGSLLSDHLPTSESEIEAQRKELAKELSKRKPDIIDTTKRREINRLLEGISIDVTSDEE